MQINIGSGSGMASGGKRGGCSLFGIIFGLFLVPLGFYLVYYGEARLVNHGKVFDSVEMMTVEQAKTAPDGSQVKFKGIPDAEPLYAERYEKPVVYFSRTIEEYEREEDSDGDVSYSWNTKESTYKFAPMNIEDINVEANRAKPVGATTVFVGIRPTNFYRDTYDPSLVDRSPKVGDRRLTVKVIDVGQELVVFGDKMGNTVAGGTTFVVSAMSEQATSEQLHTEYKIWYWAIKGIAIFCIGFGILSIFGPLLTLVGYIPFIGTRMTGAFGCFAFAFAGIAVILTTLLIKLLWPILILAALGIIIGVTIAIKSPSRPPSEAAGPIRTETPAAMPPAGVPQAPVEPAPTPVPTPTPDATPVPTPTPVTAPTEEAAAEDDEASDDEQAGPKCPACGETVGESDWHCMNCGAKLGD